MKVTVTAPSRLHLGLAGMGAQGVRCFGGVGLAISHYATTVTVERRPGSNGITIIASDELCELLAPIIRDTGCDGLTITVHQLPPRHCGFGTGTALRLAALEGVALVSGNDAGGEVLRTRSGRGGASGVGINSYFLGGLIGDGGHRRTPATEILPSGSLTGAGRAPPRPIWRKDWPEQWRVAVCHPANHRRISGPEEERFFRSSFPVPADEVDAAIRTLFFELPASLEDLDFAGFRSCLAQSRALGFKRREIGLREEVHGLAAGLGGMRELAFTMSSIGPAVAIFYRDEACLSDIGPILPDGWLLVAGAAANAGRSVRIEP